MNVEQILKFDEKESKLFLPNEIFKDLKTKLSRSDHIAFAYAYYYLITWLYRNVKYDTVRIDGKPINNKHIKQILGYHPEYKGINNIIKKNGILEQLQYITTSTDIPIEWSLNEFNDIDFTMMSEMDAEILNIKRKEYGKSYKIRFPIKAFWRTEEDREDNHYNGTFDDISDTFKIPFEVFAFCMDRNKVHKEVNKFGLIAFYIYSYIKQKNFSFASYGASLDKLAKETKISRSHLWDVLDLMKKYNMITCTINQEYVIGLNVEDRKPNSYRANDYHNFLDTPEKEYRKAKVITFNTYEQQNGKKNSKLKEEIDDGFEAFL